MHLVVIGLNHRTAPVEVREKLAVSEGNLPKALATLNACHCVLECCILSTCNRTEIYAVTDTREDEEALVQFISDYHEIARESFDENLYRYRGHKAVSHIFGVAAGIDSMMVGENQIMNQVKNAFCVAGESDVTKAILNNLFQQALYVGKRARSETEISRGAFSVGYAAVELARSIFGELRGHSTLVLGAGKMSELTARHLKSAGADSISVSNRTFARAEELAGKLDGRAVEFERFHEEMAHVDIVIASTGASEAVVARSMMAKIMRERRNRPIFMIDIAVPRDIEPGVGELDGVFLYDIDDLDTLVQQSIRERSGEIDKVREIIAEETTKFSSWLRTLEAVPLIKQLRDKYERLRDAEWERTSPRLSHLAEEDQVAIRVMMQSLVNKISHDPLLKLKEYAANGDDDGKLDVARELFGIEDMDSEVEE
jgi:glutamyl-tRNA reductase